MLHEFVYFVVALFDKTGLFGEKKALNNVQMNFPFQMVRDLKNLEISDF
jgi:hypothetical protein